MTIVVVCQFCRTKYRFRDDSAGQRVTCEHCGDIIAVPSANGHGTSLEELARFGSELAPAALREAGPPRRLDPDRRTGPKDPTRPAVSDQMYKVSIGLRLVFLDALFSGLIFVLLIFSPFLVPRLPIPLIGPWLFRSLVGLQWLWVLMMALGMVGRWLCLVVPSESQAKPYIFSSLLLELFFLLVCAAEVSGEVVVPEEAWIAGQISQFLGHVLFLGFLRRLAAYLRREDLYAIAQRSFALGAVFVVAAVLAVLSRIFFLPWITVLFFMCNLLAGPFLFFPYLRLLTAFRKAVQAVL